MRVGAASTSRSLADTTASAGAPQYGEPGGITGDPVQRGRVEGPSVSRASSALRFVESRDRRDDRLLRTWRDSS